MTTHHPHPPAPSPPALVSCRHLTKRFGAGPPAVDDLSFDVAAGSITGFIGANGAGKTTTMRMLLGLVHPTAGSALVCGHRYQDLVEPRRQVGALLDGPGANPAHRVRTHLRLVAHAAGLPSDHVEDALDAVGLRSHGRRRAGALSLGMRQRLGLATALLGDPRVLLLDEPVNGLDPAGILWIRSFLRRQAADGRAVLVSSHLLAELAEVADRVVIIDRGRLVTAGPLDDVAAGRSLEDVYFALAGRVDDDHDDLWEAS